jgi:hypothetical protein
MRAAPSELRLRTPSMSRRRTLLEIAAWCAEEYRLLCMLPARSPDTEAALQISGMKTALARLEAHLKSSAETGEALPHQKVRDEWRLPFERQAREDEEMLLPCLTTPPKS